jgi:hypothetical protein
MPNFSLANNLLISKNVKSTLSAEEWKLDTHKHSTFMMNKIATYLNKRLESGFNNGLTHKDLRSIMLGLMHEFRLYGASGGGSVKVLDEVLKKIFPKGSIHETEFKH